VLHRVFIEPGYDVHALELFFDKQIKLRIVLTLLIRWCSFGHLPTTESAGYGTLIAARSSELFTIKHKGPTSFDSGPLYFCISQFSFSEN